MKLELIKDPNNGGVYRDIIIDGVKWGTVAMTHHGSHGTSYTFFDIFDNKLELSTDQRGVWSDKVYAHRRKSGDPYLRLDQRIESYIEQLVAKAILRSPDALERERAAQLESYRTEREARQKRRRIEVEAKAKDALDAGTVEAVIAAMRWYRAEEFL